MIVAVDTETLGLDPDRHPIWEAAAIVYDEERDAVRARFVWQIRLTADDLDRADPIALRIGRFEERRASDDELLDPAEFAAAFAEITTGAHLLGAVPSFDEERLRRLLARHDVEHGWHYHLIDVETLAIGYLLGRTGRLDAPNVARHLPWNSAELTDALGIDVEESSKHTALGDAEWALAIWRRVNER